MGPNVRQEAPVAEYEAWLKATPDWAFDLETTTKPPYSVLTWAVSDGNDSWVYSISGDRVANRGAAWKLFLAAFAAPGLRIVQNGAFDLPILLSYGAKILWDNVVDTMIAGALLEPDSYSNLGHLAARYLDVYAWKHTSDSDQMYYNGLDAAYTSRIWEKESELLASSGQKDFFLMHVMPLLGAVIIPLNQTGIKMDVKHRKEILDEWKKRLGTWHERLEKHFGQLSKTLNTSISTPIGKSGGLSAKQVGNILYTQLGLPVQRHPKTKAVSVDKSALAKLSRLDSSGTVDLLLERATFKSLEVHLGVPPGPDGRVRSRYVLGGDEKHREFTEHGSARSRDKGAATGRLASRSPNHQNVPEDARVIYIPTHHDWSLLEADHSQIELRLTAFFSGDRALAKAIESDAHLFTTWQVDQITGLYNFEHLTYEELHQDYLAGNPKVKQARQECKRISLGWSYRMGAMKLENTTGIPYQRGRKALDGLNASYPDVVRWWDSLVSLVKAQGYLSNPFGRRRYFSPSEVPAICNFLSQSTGADILFDGQLRLATALPSIESTGFLGRLIATVHDSNLLEGPDATIGELATVVSSCMEHPIATLNSKVFPITIKTGKNWKELT
jgi:DNA polymerase-1